MSTVNTMPNSQTPPQLPELREPITAEQIETNCPDHLQQLGNEIAARIRKANKQIEQARDHAISVNQLMAEAKELCDGGGFHAFQKKFFPDLSKSRVYELLAIGTDKKSVEEIRADTRVRVAKHRANRAAARNSVTVTENSGPELCTQAPDENGEVEAPGIASEQTPEPEKPWTPNSVTVTDKSKPEPCTQGVPNENGEVEAPGIASGQTLGPSKPWRERASVEGMRVFTAHTTGLDKAIKKRPPEHFSETAVSVEIIEHLARFYTGLAEELRR